MEWLIYLLEVSVCLAIFYGFYHLSLRKLTFFGINRLYLISTLLLSLLIPSFKVAVISEVQQVETSEIGSADFSTFTDLSQPQTDESKTNVTYAWLDQVNWPEVLLAIYWLVAGLMFSMLVYQTWKLLRHARHVDQRLGRLKIVYKNEGFSNCSFMNYVFVNRKELGDHEISVILKHEQIHVARFHSLDRLLVMICRTVLWFNPVIYLYVRALEQVHEYEADKATSVQTGETSYANLLLALAVRNSNPMAHGILQKPLKGRIKMLFTKKSNDMKKLIYLAVLPIGLLLAWVFSVQTVYAAAEAPAKLNLPMPAVVPVLSEPSIKPVDEPSATITKKAVNKPQSDTLRMIDGPDLGPNPEVTIDGKEYPADILTKISPRSAKKVTTYVGRIEIVTKNNKIEYATGIDRENVIARNKAHAKKKFYVRYPAKHEDGSSFDQILVKLPHASHAVGVPTDAKLLFRVKGIAYSEVEAMSFASDHFDDLNSMKVSEIAQNADLKAEYGSKYFALVDIYSDSGRSKVKPRDTSDKLRFVTKGPVVYDREPDTYFFEDEATITKNRVTVIGDRARFHNREGIAYVKNATLTGSEGAIPVKAAFMKVNFNEGTFEVLDDIPDL